MSLLSRISEKLFGSSTQMRGLRASQEKRKVEKERKAEKRRKESSGLP